MHECMLCERDMKKCKNRFGSGCINNIYNFLAATSMKLGVMKEYKICINFKINEIEVKQ